MLERSRQPSGEHEYAENECVCVCVCECVSVQINGPLVCFRSNLLADGFVAMAREKLEARKNVIFNLGDGRE